MELSAAEEQCQTLRNDLDSSEVSKDQLVKKAWDARDAAVQRKNASEIELAKERVNCIQVHTGCPNKFGIGSEMLANEVSIVNKKICISLQKIAFLAFFPELQK